MKHVLSQFKGEPPSVASAGFLAKEYLLPSLTVRVCFSLLCFVCCLLVFHPRANADSILVTLDSKTVKEDGTLTSTHVIQACRKANSIGADYLIFSFDCEAGRINLIDRAAKELKNCKSTTVAFIEGKCWGAPLYLALHCDLVYFKVNASISPYASSETKQDELNEPLLKDLISAINSSNNYTHNQNLKTLFFSTSPLYKVVISEEAKDILNLSNYRYFTITGKAGLVCIVNEQLKDELVETLGAKILTSPEKFEMDFPLTVRENRSDIQALSLKGDFVLDLSEVLTDLEKTGRTAGIIISQEVTILDRAAEILNHPVVLCFLLTLGFLALLIEIKAPGIFIGAILSILFFSIFFLSNYVCGTADFLEIIIFLVGLTLLILELTIIPGFGIAGAGGILLLLCSLFAAIIPGYFPGAYTSAFDSYFFGLTRAGEAFATLLSSFLFMALGAMMISKFLPGIPGLKRLVHTYKQHESSYESLTQKSLVYAGKTGIALTDLRPSGKIEIEGKKVEARSNGGYISKGSTVKVVKVDFGVLVEQV